MPFLIIIGVVLLIWIFVKAYNDYKKEKAYKEKIAQDKVVWQTYDAIAQDLAQKIGVVDTYQKNRREMLEHILTLFKKNIRDGETMTAVTLYYISNTNSKVKQLFKKENPELSFSNEKFKSCYEAKAISLMKEFKFQDEPIEKYCDIVVSKIQSKSSLNGTEQSSLLRAKELAEKIGLMPFYEKNKDLLEKEIKRFVTLKNSEKMIQNLIYFYVYGIYDDIKTLYLKECANTTQIVDLDNDRIFVQVKIQFLATIEQFPPLNDNPKSYVDMIRHLTCSQTDEAACEILEAYGREIPERFKKLLANDKKALVEHWFGNIVLAVKQAKFNMFEKDKYITLDLILFHYFQSYIAFCNIVNSQKKATDFYKNFFNAYSNYALENVFESSAMSDEFFNNRMDKYNSVMMSDSAEKGGNLLICFGQFITKDLAKKPLSQNIIADNVIESFKRNAEAKIFNEHLAEKLSELFQRICQSYIDSED